MPTNRRRPNTGPKAPKGSTNRRRAAPERLPPPTPSEAAFEALLRSFDEPARVRAAAPAPVDDRAGTGAFLERLYANARTYLSTDPYAAIGDASGFNTKIVGVTFEGRQDLVAGVRPGERLVLVREPENPKDPNAIAVCYGALKLGFFRAAIA